MPVTRHVADMVAEARQQIPAFHPEDAAAMQASGEAVLVDIRDVRELRQDRQDRRCGACAAWHDRILGRPAKPLSQGNLCHRQEADPCLRLRLALGAGSKTLIEMGMDNVHDLEGGFGAQAKSGQPVITE